MDGATFIGRFREETMDEEAPYLWPDALILRYLDEAQVAFCRRTEGIEDSTSPICTVAVPAGATSVALSPKILKVRAAYLAETGHTLEIGSVEGARRDGVLPRTGTPHTILLKLSAKAAQIIPAPATDVTLKLDVFRLPLKTVDASDATEVDDVHSTTLMHYALYRAYSRPDPDAMDRVRADYFHQLFLDDCREAKREQGRARKPNGATIFSW